MGTDSGVQIGEVSPDEAWRLLQSAGPECRLVDVRTRAEWGFVGVPDLEELDDRTIFVEWASFPDMSVNPHFAAEVREALGDTTPGTLLFLCRSGARSLRAAFAVATAFSSEGTSVDCINVAEGFEGDMDGQGHRGRKNGWKARGLAWRQS